MRATVDFLLHDWLRVEQLTARERFADHSRETFAQVLDTCERIARDKYAPFNRLVDTEEPRLVSDEGGERVVLPQATHEAWRAYAESGMLAAAQDFELGGMQLPYAVEAAANAFFAKASVSIGAGMLTTGNANLLMAHGTPRQQQVFAHAEFAGAVELRFGRLQVLPLASLGVAEFGEVVGDARGVLLGALARLHQFQVLDLQRVGALLQGLGLLAPSGQQVLQRGDPAFCFLHPLVRLFRRFVEGGQAGFQFVDFPLPLEHALSAGVAGMARQPGGVDHLAVLRHQPQPDRQRRLQGGQPQRIVAAEVAAQPVVERGADPQVVAADQRTHRPATLRAGDIIGARARIEHQADAGRRRIGDQFGQTLGTLDRQRRQPLAQHRLEGSFPAGLDMHLLPQWPPGVDAVAGKPGTELATFAHPRLQLAQGLQPGPRLGTGPVGAALGLGRLAQRRLPLRQVTLEAGDRFVEAAALAVQRHDFALDACDLEVVGGRQRRVAASEPAAPLGQRVERPPCAGAMGLLHPHLLLDLGQFATHRLGGGFGAGRHVLEFGQALGRLVVARPRLFRAQARVLQQFPPALALAHQIGPAALPVAVLVAQFPQPALDAVAIVAQALDLGLQPADFGSGGVEFALRRVDRLGSLHVGLAAGLDGGFQRLQPRAAGLHRAAGVGHLLLQPPGFVTSLVALEQPQQVLALGVGVAQLAVARRHFGLTGQVFDALAQFHADVVEARQVVAGVSQPPFCLPPALAILGDTRSLFEEAADLLRPRLDDARDHALLDDRVGARPEAGTEKQVDDVLAPDLGPVDEVARLATAVEHPLDRDLRVLGPLARRLALGVVEDQFDTGPRHRLAAGRTVEDDVLHRFAAQRRRPRLAQHPAYGVDDVRLAAAVGPDHADQLAGGVHRGRVDESLETGEFELGQAHVSLGAAIVAGGRSRPSRRRGMIAFFLFCPWPRRPAAKRPSSP